MLQRIYRALLARYLIWQANAIRAERRQYEATGKVGPIYIFNSTTREIELRLRARRLVN